MKKVVFLIQKLEFAWEVEVRNSSMMWSSSRASTECLWIHHAALHVWYCLIISKIKCVGPSFYSISSSHHRTICVSNFPSTKHGLNFRYRYKHTFSRHVCFYISQLLWYSIANEFCGMERRVSGHVLWVHCSYKWDPKIHYILNKINTAPQLIHDEMDRTHRHALHNSSCKSITGNHPTLWTSNDTVTLNGQQARCAVDVATQQHTREVAVHFILLWKRKKKIIRQTWIL